MVDEGIKAQIIKDLARHHTKNHIITELCESTGMNWVDAESLVNDIEQENSLEIYSRQKPFLLILGFTIALGGLMLSGFMIYETLTGLIIYVGMVPVPYLGNLIFLGLGLGMVIGGTRGVIKTLSD